MKLQYSFIFYRRKVFFLIFLNFEEEILDLGKNVRGVAS